MDALSVKKKRGSCNIALHQDLLDSKWYILRPKQIPLVCLPFSPRLIDDVGSEKLISENCSTALHSVQGDSWFVEWGFSSFPASKLLGLYSGWLVRSCFADGGFGLRAQLPRNLFVDFGFLDLLCRRATHQLEPSPPYFCPKNSGLA